MDQPDNEFDLRLGQHGTVVARGTLMLDYLSARCDISHNTGQSELGSANNFLHQSTVQNELGKC